MSHAHITGCMFPQTPTPVPIRYAIKEKHMIMVGKLMPNEIHHHNGVLASTTPATVSESQPGLRWLSTSGSLANSARQ